MSAIARDVVRHRLVALVAERTDVVLDLSLWRRADREHHRALVEITAGRLACYLDGFQTPTGEGEVVLTPEQAATWWPPPRSAPNRPGS